MSLVLRAPTVHDGAAVHSLVEATGVLDLNSPYAYLLMGLHFASSSVVAEEDGEILGFIFGYLIPDRPEPTVFVWQVGVDAAARGRGLATQMLRWLVQTTGARRMETTITPSNQASQRLFRGFAEKVGASCEREEGLPSSLFAGPDHEPEELYQIGPFRSDS